jgi:phage terminase small subunit
MADQAKTRKKPKLTPKQGKFIKGVIEGKTMVQAAMEAYPNQTYGSARVQASQNLTKPNIREVLEAEYAKQGITTKAVVSVLSDAMKADKVYFVGSGEDREMEREPDHSIRINAVRTAMQLIGVGKEPAEGGGVHFHFNPQSYIKKS